MYDARIKIGDMFLDRSSSTRHRNQIFIIKSPPLGRGYESTQVWVYYPQYPNILTEHKYFFWYLDNLLRDSIKINSNIGYLLYEKAP